MRDILEDLARSERGRRLLINLLRSLEAEHTDKKSALTVLRSITLSSPPHKNCWLLHVSAITRTIFGTPDEFQFKGPASTYSPAEWMTIKSMRDLYRFMEGATGRLSDSIKRRLNVIDPTGAHQGLGDEYYIRFAEALSDDEGAITFLLAKTFGASGRPGPSWYSRWCQYPYQHLAASPSQQSSGRMRDWLGLPYGKNEALFMIRAREKMDVARLNAYRPTPWDGFDNPLYKHGTSDQFASEGCGSTADISLLRTRSAPGSDVEGGPEMVSRGVTFDPKLFVCEYLGTAPAAGYDLLEDPFHRVLLRADETIEKIVERLTETLDTKRTAS